MRRTIPIFLVALACDLQVEGTNAEGAAESSTGDVVVVTATDGRDDGGTGDAPACAELHDAEACAAAGCLPLPVTPIVNGIDGAVCESGDPIVVCTPPAEAQPCEDAATCVDGRFAWALPMPDGAALIAVVEESCNLPPGFVPCPAIPDPDAQGDTHDTTGGVDATEPLVQACACACAIEIE